MSVVHEESRLLGVWPMHGARFTRNGALTPNNRKHIPPRVTDGKRYPVEIRKIKKS